jgi:DNA-binding NtrC family response regulator
MELVADRFVMREGEGGRACDLASGSDVVLVVGSAGGVSDQLRWADRCSALRALHHDSIAPLVDFGLLGDASRFEAWACGRGWAGAAEVSASIRNRVKQFLGAAGLSAGPLAAACVRTSDDGTARVLPEAGTGYTQEPDPGAAETPLRLRGLGAIERRAVSVLSEMFAGIGGCRPHVAALSGLPGSGKRVVVRELARIARMHGFVPVASRLVASRYAEMCRGRSLFVIGDEGDNNRWPAFVDVAVRDAQPHVLLMVGNGECRSIDSVRLDRVTADALISAIRPQPLGRSLERLVRRAAERAQGLPGRFVRLLWPKPHAEDGADRRSARRGMARVAERPAVYGREEAADDLLHAPAPACAWPAPGELSALRRRRDAAVVHLAHGRHAPGLRQLRQAIGGLARRSDWTHAADGALDLAGALLRRGRARDAVAAIEDGRQYARRSGRDGVLLDLATLNGEAWIDLARLDEAESVLATVLAAARADRDPARVMAASVALARALYWRGRYADAAAALGTPPPEGATLRVRYALLAARIAVGLRDLNRAMSLVLEAGEWASAGGAAGNQAAVSFTAAFVHLAVGDLEAVERDLAESMAAARAAHDPLRAIRARLLGAEAERSRGRHASAIAQLGRLRRVMATTPPALRARWELASALATGGGDPQAIVAQRVAATGLGALALYVSGPRGLLESRGVTDPFVDELVAILRVCQAAEDDAAVLKEVCVRVRQHLRASGVAFVAVLGPRADIVCGDGVRLDTAVAARAIDAGITIAPHRRDDRIEAAAPVQYGGAPIGVLCARWTLGSTDDTSRAASVLTMSAAAAAPILAAAIARRQQPPIDGTGELLGVTPVVAELRTSVERAAAAPFSVLIDGESGSGKELVARAIHRGGSRRHRTFCTLNCAALPDDLVEAELFGHARGAFTGAASDRAGVFEEAHGGTLFLDEIGELAARAQAKVLRVLQEGELRRVGENVSRRVDVRIVAATNRDLRREVDAGRFRLDLLYRLDVVHITVPPLRDRREDIVVLAEHFWREAAARVGSRATLGVTTIAALAGYDWPGNVRELQNVLAALAVRSPRRGVIPPSALPAPFAVVSSGAASRLEEARRTFEERFVRAALVRTGGHRGRAAAELGVTRQGLSKLMTRLGISP